MMDSGIKYKREASNTTEVNNKNMMKLSIKKEFVRSGTVQLYNVRTSTGFIDIIIL